MNLAIRRASLTDDRQEMVELLNQNFGLGQEMRFAWRHEGNPAGPGWSWVLYDRGLNASVGMTSVFPRRVYVGGRSVLCGQVGEFSVAPTHRSLGPALLLQRATFEPVDSGGISFCYDCPPHDRGMSTFKRLGMLPSCVVVRHAIPFRSDAYLEKRLGNGAWTKPVVAATNVLLRTRKAAPRISGLQISRFDERFGEEFSELDRQVASAGVIRNIRSAEDLNWRYRENPQARNRLPNGNQGGHRVLVARRAGELVAFLVLFLDMDGVALIADLFGRQLSEAGAALLGAAIEVCRQENCLTLQGFCSAENELSQLFRNAGFHPRETAARVVAYERPNNRTGKLLNSGVHWAFSQVEMMV